MKKTINNYAKEGIRSRILQNATKLWGVTNPQALDPFVTLLVDAFSTEIFKVNNDIENIKGSILEKLAKLLTPSIYTYPRPAHAIAMTNPLQAQEVLLNHQEFFTKKIFTSNVKTVADLNLDIPFTAVDQVKLINATVKYKIIGNMIWENDNFYNSIPTVKVNQSTARNQLFLAFDLSAYDSENTPERFSLYCDNPAYDSLEFVYKLLPFVSMSYKGSPLQVSRGLTYPVTSSKEGYEATFEEYSIENRIQENIKSIYAGKFIEISGFKRKIADLELDVLPQEIAFLNENSQIRESIAGQQLLWIQFDFPPQYTREIIEGFSFYLNAFPVYNRGWKQNESSLDIMGNTIPLVTQIGEEFLYTHKVVDSHSRLYSEIPFSESNSLTQGLYAVRKGGMERFSERNAIDLIAHVLELTRDEVSAFSILDRDKVIETLRKMVYQMRELNQKVKTVDNSVARDVHYIIVEPLEKTEYVKASYWVTHCSLANTIRKGTQLIQQNKVFTNVNRHLILLSTTKGGDQEKTGTDAIQAYKYALTTRDKIICKEDIKNYCKMVLQDHCQEVLVSRGIKVGDNPKEGFIHTVNIVIVVDNYEEWSSQYWIDYARSLQEQITNRAIDGVDYLVEFKGEIFKEEM
ncbi:type VI secretion system baseplate subunit TssF [Myroides sp. WP-1]|uniref:type VI secretion system baseplate subunit TssF n=1 Tax=Myroides sp. WP-1 TaxID=2759944 RepID=UPI0015FA5EDB|nr:type VI secretion system baseplate subunit TssF [Myroides sp. WP-1]MBB1139386.1 type VI secretion system baseplate subunit TssF [Myroides sp. WP-1]